VGASWVDDGELHRAPRRRPDVTEVVEDGEALLYEPDGNTHRLTGLATVLWHCLDGSVSLRELADELGEVVADSPAAAEEQVRDHVRLLFEAGLLLEPGPADGRADGGGRRADARPVQPSEAVDGPELVAHRLDRGAHAPIVAAPGRRRWMDSTVDRFAYRCLPLKIANESGWVIESEHAVLVTWDGGPGLQSLEITCLRGASPCAAVSHFGHGILTWTLPYLFRTSPGYNLLMRGPANWPKDGAYPLEGLIETDWTAATATMNWKLTRPGLTVRFDVGDPIAMLVPTRRGELEAVRPRVADIDDETEMAGRYRRWAASRAAFLGELPTRGAVPRSQSWEKHYMRGQDVDGRAAPEHQRRRVLHDFAPVEGAGGHDTGGMTVPDPTPDTDAPPDG
jgi:hypothetical protein